MRSDGTRRVSFNDQKQTVLISTYDQIKREEFTLKNVTKTVMFHVKHLLKTENIIFK